MSRTIALPTLRTEAMHASARLIHRSAVPRLELFPFRYRNPITSKSVRAVRGIAGGDREGNAEWEIIDPPEMRQLDLDARRSTPVPVRCAHWRACRAVPASSSSLTVPHVLLTLNATLEDVTVPVAAISASVSLICAVPA